MNYPFQRSYWTRRRVWLLVALLALTLFGGTHTTTMAGLAGLLFGVVLSTVLLISIYHGSRRVLSRAW